MQTQRISLSSCSTAASVRLGRHATAGARRVTGSRSLVMRTHAAVTTSSVVTKTGAGSVQGTSRKQNEDRLVQEEVTLGGKLAVYAAVFDGHGGYAASDWLQKNLLKGIDKAWASKGASPERDITDAFLKADAELLKPQGGFLGMGERGVGGSKCGSTAAVAVLFEAGGAVKLLTANVGDARVLLVKKSGEVVQLTEDHVPDNEEERNRIEATNPNPKMPLVRYVGGTWRTGGLLALSRAFGDAYLKSTMQFEGVSTGTDGYSSGFGVICEPTTSFLDLTAEDSHLIVCSDGLFANEERGGGGGLPNETVASMCLKAGDKDLKALAYEMAEAAQEAGSTDDISVVILQLNAP